MCVSRWCRYLIIVVVAKEEGPVLVGSAGT